MSEEMLAEMTESSTSTTTLSRSAPGALRSREVRPMKLVIQIPCYNEAETLPETLADLPRKIEGFDEVEILIVDDGSRDDSVDVAYRNGAHHVVSHNHNRGLAQAFMTGLETALARGADVIVNTDADNQYNARDIEHLVMPILAGDADLVVGARPIRDIAHFSAIKRLLQRVGSRVVRTLSRTSVEDAPSGFRAMTREAAQRLNVFTSYTYTLETIIQAGLSNLRVVNVPVGVTGPTRPSRLVKSTWSYVTRSIMTMLSVHLVYSPLKLFGFLASLFLVPGIALGLRYLWLMYQGQGAGHVQSVILAGVLLVSGVFMLAMAALVHLIAINRRLLEELRFLERRKAGKHGS